MTKKAAAKKPAEPKPEPEKQPSLLPQDPPKSQRKKIALDDLPANSKLVCPEPSSTLIDSIKAIGVMCPIILAASERGEKTVFNVADGKRRVKAAREAGLKELDAVIYQADDLTPEIITITAHATRKENRAAEYLAICQLIDNGANNDQLREATGLTIAQINRTLRFGNLNADLMSAFKEGRISPSVATQCVRLSKTAQGRLARTLDKEGKLTSDDVAEERRVRSKAAAASLPGNMFEQPKPPAEMKVTHLEEGGVDIIGARFDSPEAAIEHMKSLIYQLKKGKPHGKESSTSTEEGSGERESAAVS
jgi:ParB/RepB/Spo0J family partition protein